MIDVHDKGSGIYICIEVLRIRCGIGEAVCWNVLRAIICVEGESPSYRQTLTMYFVDWVDGLVVSCTQIL
jgi:hypothetical protein